MGSRSRDFVGTRAGFRVFEHVLEFGGVGLGM